MNPASPPPLREASRFALLRRLRALHLQGRRRRNRLPARRHPHGNARRLRLIASLAKEAIDAANRAIALDPKLNEARFNKALANDDPKKPAESIREWNDYLKHDPTGPWADEAKRKIDNNLP